MGDGLVAEHITFLQRRKLCLMTWLQNTGGTCELIYRPDMEKEPASLPLSSKKMLIFKADQMTYQYAPADGPSAVLLSWILSPKVELKINGLSGDAQMKSDIMGIHKG